MSQMTLHLLNAQGTLAAHAEWLTDCLTQTYQQAQNVMPLPCLDVVVKAGGYTLPEKGHAGYCPESGVVYITVDPANPAFAQNQSHSLEHMFAHELHHAARWTGPGYGVTLGEAVVSEGLAGHFSLELFAGEPEPWESLAPEIVSPHLQPLAERWQQTDYDHPAWFFGTSHLPRWLGYSAGFNAVANYLAAKPELKASMLAHLEDKVVRDFI